MKRHMMSKEQKEASYRRWWWTGFVLSVAGGAMSMLSMWERCR